MFFNTTFHHYHCECIWLFYSVRRACQLRILVTMQQLLPGYIVSSLPLLCPLDVSPELCFDVSSDPQLSSILSSQNRHLSIHMHQGTFLTPAHSCPATFFLRCVFLHFNSAALSNCNPVWWFRWPQAPLLQAVSHAITIIYKTHSGSVAQAASPGLSSLHTTVNICTQFWTVERFHGGESLHYMKYSGRMETPMRRSTGFLLRFDYTSWFFHELWQSCWIRVSSESLW